MTCEALSSGVISISCTFTSNTGIQSLTVLVASFCYSSYMYCAWVSTNLWFQLTRLHWTGSKLLTSFKTGFLLSFVIGGKKMKTVGVWGPFGHPSVDATLFTFQGMTGRLKWPQEKWKANIEELDSMMLLIDVKLKNNHTSLKRGCISKAIMKEMLIVDVYGWTWFLVSFRLILRQLISDKIWKVTLFNNREKMKWKLLIIYMSFPSCCLVFCVSGTHMVFNESRWPAKLNWHKPT